MERSKIKLPSSPMNNGFENFDDFVFLADDEDLDFNSEPTPAKSPAKAAIENFMKNTVILALTNVTSKENLLVANMAKTALTGAASTLSASVGGASGLAVGALIAGGIYAYNSIRNKSAMEMIKSLSPRQQKQLLARLADGLKGLGIRDLAQDIMHRNEVRDIALAILSNFLTEKFNVKLIKA